MTTNSRSQSLSKSRIHCSGMKMMPVVVAMAFVGATMPTGTLAFVTRFPSADTRTASLGKTLQYMSFDQVSDFYQNFPIQSAVLTCGVKASVADTIAQVKPQIEVQKKMEEEQQQQQVQSSSGESFSPTSTVSTSSLQSSHEGWRKKLQQTLDLDIGWEASRNLAYVLYGGIFVGLMSHVEYNVIFPIVFGNEKTWKIIVEEVFFDNLIAAPVMWLPPAYFIKAWIYRASKSSVGDSSNDHNADSVGIFQEGLEKYLADVKDNKLLLKYWSIWFPAHSVSFSVVPDHLRVAFMACISFFWFILFSSVSSQGDAAVTEKAE
mmetsp:Transcript_34558/g.81470  ORF Transcript_34558/g.81470 Transcript_34558/m.81470 type:complete len:320 (+) Transcript_34558:221-1180(+)